MKQYEQLNEILEENKSPEEHAVGMLVSGLLDEHEIEYDDRDIDEYEEEFKKRLKWLNSEVE